MSRLRLLSIIFLIIAFIAFIPLTIEIFGDMNTDIIIISAKVFGIGMIGVCVCSIARAIREFKKNFYAHGHPKEDVSRADGCPTRE